MSLLLDPGYWRFRLRCWRAGVPDRLCRWLAYKVSRKVALFTYIRVFACTAWDYDPDMREYEMTCKAWEAGKGL